MYCSNCGKQIDEKAVVCIYCGVATKNMQQEKSQDMTLKSKMAAGLMAVLIGAFGIHNFYLGYKDKAIIQLLLTVVGWIFVIGPMIAGIWALIEGIQIFTGDINKDSDGRPLRD